MAKNEQPTDDQFSNLPNVSDIINPADAGEIIHKMEDVQNRQLILVEAGLEVGTFGTYAKMRMYDPATKVSKIVTNGSTLIMTQISALLAANAIPCKVKVMKDGKTWTLR